MEKNIDPVPGEMKKVICRNACLVGIGLTLLLVGGLVGGLWFKLFDLLLGSQMILNTNSKSYELWKETPLPLYIDFYFFNWTNPEETLNKGVKPNFVEVGPYIFKEAHTKVNMKWHTNGTVTFQQVRKWNFVPEQSNGSLSDLITNINVIAMTVGNVISKNTPPELLPIIDALIKHEENIYVTKPVGDYLFNGYYDRFLNLTTIIKRYIKLNIPYDKFGWFYNRNMSAVYDGTFNMYTGSTGLSVLGDVYSWNNQTSTKFFNGQCSEVRGTTGELWPPSSPSKKVLEVFASDVCSWVAVTQHGTMSVFNLEGNQYLGDERTFDNGTLFPENKCFCLKKKCQPSGLRDLSSCRLGAPALVSFPHFLHADPYYRSLINGMNPDPKKHQFVMALEKNIGIPLYVQARLQINIFVEPIRGLKFFRKLPVAYFPQIWFNQRAEITEDLASQLQPLEILNRVVQPIFFTLCALGVVIFLTGVFLCHRLRRNKRQKDLLMAGDSGD